MGKKAYEGEEIMLEGGAETCAGFSLAIKSLLRKVINEVQSTRDEKPIIRGLHQAVRVVKLCPLQNISVTFCNDRTVAIASNESSCEVPSGSLSLRQSLSIFVIIPLSSYCASAHQPFHLSSAEMEHST